MKHTPGPWVHEAKVGWVMSSGGRYGVDGPMHVADVRGWGYLTGAGQSAHMGHDEALAVQEANGNLLAAAPEMYDAIRWILTDMSYAAPETMAARLGGYADKMRAVLAKAEGRG